jgi:hypothetical protein
MEIKKGQLVELWNGNRGSVLDVLNKKAHLLLDNGKRIWEPVTAITSTKNVYSEKDARFLQAKDKLEEYKKSTKKLAPGKVDEDKWDEAKQTVKKQRNKNIEEFSDRDWGLVNHIYQEMGGEFESEASCEKENKLNPNYKVRYKDRGNKQYVTSSSKKVAFNKERYEYFVSGYVDPESPIYEGSKFTVRQNLESIMKNNPFEVVFPSGELTYKNSGGYPLKTWVEVLEDMGYNTEIGEYTMNEHNDEGDVVGEVTCKEVKVSSKKVAAHPNDFNTKYPIGTILVPSNGDRTEFVHVLDINEETKTYVLEKRPVSEFVDKDDQIYGVRYEVPVSKLDDEKGLKVFSNKKVSDNIISISKNDFKSINIKSCPEVVDIDKTGSLIKLVFSNGTAQFKEDGTYVCSSINLNGYEGELSQMIKHNKYNKLSTTVAKKKIYNKLAKLKQKSYNNPRKQAGDDRTPNYVVDVTLSGNIVSDPMEWKSSYGKPTEENLKEFVRRINKSVMPGGVNEHLGEDHIITKAVIRKNRPGAKPIVEWQQDDMSTRSAKKTALTIPEQHQKKIALDTLKMSDMGASIMGGMTKEEAREFLRTIGYSEERIKRIEATLNKNAARRYAVYYDLGPEEAEKIISDLKELGKKIVGDYAYLDFGFDDMSDDGYKGIIFNMMYGNTLIPNIEYIQTLKNLKRHDNFKINDKKDEEYFLDIIIQCGEELPESYWESKETVDGDISSIAKKRISEKLSKLNTLSEYKNIDIDGKEPDIIPVSKFTKFYIRPDKNGFVAWVSDEVENIRSEKLLFPTKEEAESWYKDKYPKVMTRPYGKLMSSKLNTHSLNKNANEVKQSDDYLYDRIDKMMSAFNAGRPIDNETFANGSEAIKEIYNDEVWEYIRQMATKYLRVPSKRLGQEIDSEYEFALNKYFESTGSKQGSKTKIASLLKKAKRLGNYDFDIHNGKTWKLEAGEDGKQKLVRL